MIIIHGRNIAPQDIEQAVMETSDLIRPGCVAAFSVDVQTNTGETEEQIVVVTEIRDEMLKESKQKNEARLKELCEKLQSAIMEEAQIICPEIIILKSKTISKTTRFVKKITKKINNK